MIRITQTRGRKAAGRGRPPVCHNIPAATGAGDTPRAHDRFSEKVGEVV